MLNGRCNSLASFHRCTFVSIRTLTECHYDVLGVPRTASDAEIKAAFIGLSKKHHPDKTNDKKSHERFIRIMEAYTILSKTDTRNAYDSKFKRYDSSSRRSTPPNADGFQWYSMRDEDADNLRPFSRYRGGEFFHGNRQEQWGRNPFDQMKSKQTYQHDHFRGSRDASILNRPFYWLAVIMLLSLAFQIHVYNKEQRRRIIVHSTALKKKDASAASKGE